MSAYVVHPAHIMALVSAAERPGQHHSGPLSWYVNHERYDVFDRNAIARMLLAENIKSVSHRYGTDDPEELPGPVPMPDLDTFCYVPPFHRYRPVEILKALDGYEYQACEHPGWPESEAKAFCNALRDRMISELPGYDEAPWEIVADRKAS